MSYNRLIADFIQHNHNISDSWVYSMNETLCNNYPFENSFDEVVSVLYYLTNEEDEPKHTNVEDMFFTLEEIKFSLVACVRLLERIKEEYTDTFNNISNNAEYHVEFNFTDGRSVDDFIKAYTMWLDGIKNR